jgi:hypothetical protein
MERVNENDQLCGQPNEVENKVTAEHFKSLENMLRCMYKKMSENNQNLEKKLSDVQVNLERKISESNQELKNYVSEIKAEMKDREEKENPELNDKFEEPADEEEGEVDNMRQKVQVENDNCTEETLKRQGERTAQSNEKSKDLQDEVLEGTNMTQSKELPESCSSICISTTQANCGVTSESVIENTRDYKSIRLFTKYAYNFITVIIDITVYEKTESSIMTK